MMTPSPGNVNAPRLSQVRNGGGGGPVRARFRRTFRGKTADPRTGTRRAPPTWCTPAASHATIGIALDALSGRCELLLPYTAPEQA
ncbi:hypothetical protein [Streptomyces sp. NPDC003015]